MEQFLRKNRAVQFHCCAQRKRFQRQFLGSKCCSIHKLILLVQNFVDSNLISWSFLIFKYLQWPIKLSSIEPVGSVSPKIQPGDEFKMLKQRVGASLNLLCPAQAYPTPVFRYESAFRSRSLAFFFESLLGWWSKETWMSMSNHFFVVFRANRFR